MNNNSNSTLLTVPHICDSSNPCENGGTCVEDGENYTCSCAEYWTGVNCQHGV